MTRIAIITALPGELKPFLDANAKEGWVHERHGNVKLWRLTWPLDQGEWIAACAGAGADAATRAFAEVERLGPIDSVISTGWAGALREELVPGGAYWVAGVIDARTGERFLTADFEAESKALKGHGFSRAVEEPKLATALAAEGMQADQETPPQGLKPHVSSAAFVARLKSCPDTKRLSETRSTSCTVEAAAFQNECWLATSPTVADAAEKQRLAATYAAALVDMEASAVARLAQMRGIPFYCVKGISDGYSDQLPDFNRFISPSGQFKLAQFIVFVLLRPRYWPALMRMGENSRRAAQGIAASLLGFLEEPGHVR